MLSILCRITHWDSCSTHGLLGIWKKKKKCTHTNMRVWVSACISGVHQPCCTRKKRWGDISEILLSFGEQHLRGIFFCFQTEMQYGSAKLNIFSLFYPLSAVFDQVPSPNQIFRIDVCEKNVVKWKLCGTYLYN